MEAKPATSARRGLSVTQYLMALLKWLAHLVAFVVLLLYSVKIVPRYIMFFEDQDALLPPVTIAVINFSNWMVSYWYLLGLGFLLVDGFVLLALELQRRAWIRSAWFTGVLLAVLMAIGWMTFVLEVPWI
ncbi:MAG: hypothetical protein WD847_03535 [Pirellulales bacterium]